MSGGWGEFVPAIAAFMTAHAVPSQPQAKAPLAGALGRDGYIVT